MKSHTYKILFIFSVAFLAVFIASPVLHNHAADFADHPLCPGHIVQTNWQSPHLFFFVIFIFNLIVRLFVFFYSSENVATDPLYTTFVNKAPPLF